MTVQQAPDISVVEGVVDVQIRPLLNVHGGDIEVLDVSEQGHIELRFHGACRTCVLKPVTYAIAVRERLLQLPGVTSVDVQGVNLSAAALERAKNAYSGYPLMFTNRQGAESASRIPLPVVAVTQGSSPADGSTGRAQSRDETC